MRVYGMEFGLSTMFYPFFMIVAILLFVFYLSMKKGRIFCSHMCPMHMFLEIVNRPKAKTSKHRPVKMWIWATTVSFLLAEIIVSFLLPLSNQATLIAGGNWAFIGTLAALVSGFLILFAVYQDHFCKKGCPYALMQMLLQSARTRYVEFSNPQKTCTNCRACDDVCPLNLRARFESRSPDCSNCNLCTEACTNELGAGNTLFQLIDPQLDGT